MIKTEFIYKVSPRGEGKTKWLVHRAQEEFENNKKVYLFTRDTDDYQKFAEDYFNYTNHVCRIEHVCSMYEVPDEGVVLIDNLLTENVNCLDVNALSGVASKVYITLEGTTTYKQNSKTWEDLYEQINIDTVEEQYA